MLHTYLPITLRRWNAPVSKHRSMEANTLLVVEDSLRYLGHRRRKVNDAAWLYRYIDKSQCRYVKRRFVALSPSTRLWRTLVNVVEKGGKKLPFPGIKPRIPPLLGNHFNKYPNSLVAILMVIKNFLFFGGLKCGSSTARVSSACKRKADIY